jgi:hypothetical protein
VPPNVTITSPATGSVFVATSTINLAADASDLDGAIYKVEFFSNGAKVGEDTSSPFVFGWGSVPAGPKLLTAVATDDSGLTRTSAPVRIDVVAGFTSNLTLISTGAVWRYLDNGSDQGTAWVGPLFNDAGWSNGPAQLGYGDGDESTVVSFGPNSAAKYITTYFRRTFNLADPAAVTSLNLQLLRDDGAVVYLNGSDIYRNNMPGGAIGYLTPALGAVPDENAWYSSPVNPGYLVPGLNILAVEIHQANGTSSDISFDFELTAVQSFLAPFIVTQPQSQTLGEGSVAGLSVVAGGATPLRYQWRRNGLNLAGATNADLVFPSVTPANAGDYSVVLTNVAGSVTSVVATITVSSQDTDGDGIPDAWERAHGLQVGINDAGQDPDHDGMTNLDEFRAGTDPQDPLSVLRVEQITASGGVCVIRFNAMAGQTYSLLGRSALESGAWARIVDVPARATNHVETVTHTNAGFGPHFYRLVTPAQ